MARQKFKVMQYQTNAVSAVVDCFAEQPHQTGFEYRVDPGKKPVVAQGSLSYEDDVMGHRNPALQLTPEDIFDQIKKVQRRQFLPVSDTLTSFKVTGKNAATSTYINTAKEIAPLHLDIEMETGTGKTYCYIKTMFEMNKRFGWSKFIVVVPSIAIREGIKKTFEDTAAHFLADYHKQARFFIYSSKDLNKVESFASDAGINVMIINTQAFNAAGTGGKDARRIFSELDEFQSRRPIDVIKAVRPILILDEPQKMEGAATQTKLKEFGAMMVLRYSATHKTQHNLIHRLDALDAYNQKLVKKIAVRGISVSGLPGTGQYLYLSRIDVSPSKPPSALLEMEVQERAGIRRRFKKVAKGDNLFVLSGELTSYKDRYVVTDINANTSTLTFENGVEITIGQARGDINEEALRRIQIRETIKAHLDKEAELFERGIKVLSLFFIDEVAKYRQYNEAGDAVGGQYATIFEEEYTKAINEIGLLEGKAHHAYLKNIDAAQTHQGYFSIDKSKRLVNPTEIKNGELAGETNDVDAYDLILKDKERLLSFEEPVRFLFSHSALREGWDNPNVFNICTLKHSDNTIARRQEVGRGLRISVDKSGDRQDHEATVHEINVLTVIANESYEDFVKGFQSELRDGLTSRPLTASEDYFIGKVLHTDEGDVTVDAAMAKLIYRYLLKNDYSDDADHITEKYHADKGSGQLADLPENLAPLALPVFALIDSVYSDGAAPQISNDLAKQVNRLNENFKKQEFQTLWKKINQKAVYKVDFDTGELVENCVKALDKELKVERLKYVVRRGEQGSEISKNDLDSGQAFTLQETQSAYESAPVPTGVKYDLIGKIAGEVELTRKTVATILTGMSVAQFSRYKQNPEGFIAGVVNIIKDQKATMVVQHLSYTALGKEFPTSETFIAEQKIQDWSKALEVKRHVYDYVACDSNIERSFATDVDTDGEVCVYAKLPRGFSIPTPVGDYNPDWAIAFENKGVKHLFFVAETKGALSSLQLRPMEQSKINCARKFFEDVIGGDVKYDVVDSYSGLMDLVKAA